MRYLLPLFECEIETMMLKTKYYRKKDYFIIIITRVRDKFCSKERELV